MTRRREIFTGMGIEFKLNTKWVVMYSLKIC
ncbi:glutamate synthase [Salmonella enterica subsp. enterica]|uniref:Glutamate synthase n=1 Tax=Salmonella enterica I TaxID=59201 RepID=A0A379W3K0_SALET|nr:glutamate synthase [Salmonella enterica subsp. enterica]